MDDPLSFEQQIGAAYSDGYDEGYHDALRRAAAGIGRCRCGHFDGQHFDEVKACDSCECAAFRQVPTDG